MAYCIAFCQALRIKSRLSLNPLWELAPSPLSFRYDRGKAFTPNKILWPELKRLGVARPGIFFGHNERFCDRTHSRKIIEGVQPQRRLDRRFALYKAAITQALFEFAAGVRASFAGHHRLKTPF